MIKKWLKIVFWILIFGGTITVFVFAKKEENKKGIESPAISIHVDGETFLTEEELTLRLINAGLLIQDQKNEQLDIRRIERKIASMEEVKEVNVFRQIGSKWNIRVILRKPIARIYNTIGQTFYIDEDGFLMSRSSNHTARVIVFSGHINDCFFKGSLSSFINNDSLKSIKKLDDVFRISNYVCNSPLMHKLIGQVYLERDGDFVLVPLVGDQKIVFGTANTDEEVAEKFSRLTTFYKEAISFEGWNKYSEISVKYGGQIVCRKRS
jgi:cell division protein FtsQ